MPPETGIGTTTLAQAKSIRTLEPGEGSFCRRWRAVRLTAAPETSEVKPTSARTDLENILMESCVMIF